jgi:hypothetical protein
MSRSEKRADWLGNEYIVHLDDSGSEIGRSRTEEKFFGGKVTKNFDADRNLQSTTETEETLLGEKRHVTRSTSGEIETVSTHESSLLGDDHYVNRDRDGNVVSRTYERKNWLGERYRETIPSSGGDGIGGIVGLVLGIAALVLMLFVAISVLLTIPIWMGAAAVAGIIAYFHAPSIAAQLAIESLPQPSAIARKRNRPPYFRFQRESLKRCLGFSTVLWIPVGAAVSFAALMAFVMGAANQRDSVGTAVFAGSVVMALIIAYRWSKRVYVWRLSEILLEPRQVDTGKAGTIARVWNVLSIGFVGLLTVGIIGSTAAYLGTPRFSNRPSQSASTEFSSSSNKADNNRSAESSRRFSTVESQQTSTPATFERPTPIPSPAASDTQTVNQFPQNTPATDETSLGFPGERFPQTRTQTLSESDISNWSASDIQYAINEIFARHGAEFPNKQVSANFAQFAWYHPQPGVSLDQIEASLPDSERSNVQILGTARNARKNGGPSAFVQQTSPQQEPTINQQVQNNQPDYPIAQWSLFNGSVASPYPPNNLIRVDNVPPGTLVTDPTTNGVFRTPIQPPEPQNFPIAQWSQVPGNVFSPYPPNNLIRVDNFAPGALVVDPTTNGVFRRPYDNGPTVNPVQVLGGLLQGMSQAIQNSGGSGQPGVQNRRKRP